jgi:hypothetical protein
LSGLFTLNFVVNATIRIAGTSSSALGAVTNTTNLTTIYPLAAADYVEVWMTGGVSRDTAVASHFFAHYLASGN